MWLLLILSHSYWWFNSLQLAVPQTVSEEMKGPLFKTAFSNIKAGTLRVYREARLRRIVLAKTTWNLAGVD